MNKIVSNRGANIVNRQELTKTTVRKLRENHHKKIIIAFEAYRLPPILGKAGMLFIPFIICFICSNCLKN